MNEQELLRYKALMNEQTAMIQSYEATMLSMSYANLERLARDEALAYSPEAFMEVSVRMQECAAKLSCIAIDLEEDDVHN